MTTFGQSTIHSKLAKYQFNNQKIWKDKWRR